MIDRERQFRDRIKVERAVISMVNRGFDRSEPIAALSMPAVTRWRAQAESHYAVGALDEMEPLLQELSRRLSINADNSREVFDGFRKDRARSADILVREIERTCRRSCRTIA